MKVLAFSAPREELREAEALWRLHLGTCEVCRRAERFHGLYCDRGRRLHGALRAAKRIFRRLTAR